jgi:ABC-type sugar transport system permease subunit
MLTARQRAVLLLPLVLVIVPFVICPALLGIAASFTN